MCGFAAIFNRNPGTPLPEAATQRVIDSLKHRGPDGNGQIHDISTSSSASLLHTRLAIIDPVPRSNQPLRDNHGNTIVFNGEIYNFRELAATHLEHHADTTIHSDTEILLLLYRKYGTSMVHHLRGMYAFVIWDQRLRQAFAARDPFGIKPLYTAHYGDRTMFASEVSAILATGLIPKELCLQGVAQFFRWGACQGHALPLKHIRMMEPGTSTLWKDGTTSPGPSLTPWITDNTTTANPQNAYRTAFQDSLKAHLVSDVPVAAFLSGGIDSASILAAAHTIGADPIPSFTLSLPGSPLDESLQAKKLARRFSSPHVLEKIHEGNLPAMFNQYLSSQDLPGIDGFNTYCISRATASHGFKVALSGLGGDELLGGYPSFQYIPRLLKVKSLTTPAAILLHCAAVAKAGRQHRRLSRILEYLKSPGSMIHAYETTRCLFTFTEINTIHQTLGLEAPLPLWSPPPPELTPMNLKEQISVLETRHYMNHQLLRDCDNFSMSHGLEIRVPFLDAALWETASSCPPRYRYLSHKRLIQSAFPELPSSLFKRPKQGFSLPWEHWIQTALKHQFQPAQHLNLDYPQTWCQSLAVVSFLDWCKRNHIELDTPLAQTR